MVETVWKSENFITTWSEFDKLVKSKGFSFFRRLDEFPGSVLVTGCQRSGTTMVSRIITQSEGMVNYWFSPDDELDAALILSGYVDHNPSGRYCFQTTYVNNPNEYLNHHKDHKIIWLVRNPISVVYSIMNNWSEPALNWLFLECGTPYLVGKDKLLFKVFGFRGIPRLRRACWGYYGKTLQIFTLNEYVGKNSIMVVDYDKLVNNKRDLLPEIYRFINLNYQMKYADLIHSKSLDKANRLSRKQKITINLLCESAYLKARELSLI